MIRTTTPAVAIAVAITSAPSGLLAAEPFVLDMPTIVRKIQPPLPRTDLRKNPCPDIHLTAHQSSTKNGATRVTIKVLNTSQADYVSAPGQQSLVINRQGKSFSVPFRNLPRGGEVTWHDTINGVATYVAAISFDPNIFTDGNPHNDDCRRSNNQASITTAR